MALHSQCPIFPPSVHWLRSKSFLTMCSFQLIYGKLYTFFSCKWVFLAAVVLFEVGSLICAVSPNSTTLIVGRAISGLGSAGINAGYIMSVFHICKREKFGHANGAHAWLSILASSLPLERRPVFVSSYSGMYGIATVAAPLMGGAFTTHSTWRWCFYINLPLGAITMVITGLFLPSFSQPRSTKPLREKWQQFDVAGTVVLILGTTCMLLTLQWGGARYGWQNGRIIALLTIFAVSMLAFIAIQYRRQERATIPPRIIQYRSVASSAGYVFAMGAGMNVLEYFVSFFVGKAYFLKSVANHARAFSYLFGFRLSRASILSNPAFEYFPAYSVSCCSHSSLASVSLASDTTHLS